VHRLDLAGPDTGPAPTEWRPGTVLVGARFRPGAGGAALGVPLSEVLDQRVDADDLPGVPRGRLPGSLSPEEAMRRVAAMAAQMVTERPPDRLVLETTGCSAGRAPGRNWSPGSSGSASASCAAGARPRSATARGC
jgi:hypothetical protein